MEQRWWSWSRQCMDWIWWGWQSWSGHWFSSSLRGPRWHIVVTEWSTIDCSSRESCAHECINKKVQKGQWWGPRNAWPCAMTNEQLVSKTTVSSIDIWEAFELEDIFFSSCLFCMLKSSPQCSQKIFTWFHGFSSAGLCPLHAVCMPSFGLCLACLSCWFLPLSSIEFWSVCEFSPFFGNCRIFGKEQFSLVSNFVLLLWSSGKSQQRQHVKVMWQLSVTVIVSVNHRQTEGVVCTHDFNLFRPCSVMKNVVIHHCTGPVQNSNVKCWNNKVWCLLHMPCTQICIAVSFKPHCVHFCRQCMHLKSTWWHLWYFEVSCEIKKKKWFSMCVSHQKHACRFHQVAMPWFHHRGDMAIGSEVQKFEKRIAFLFDCAKLMHIASLLQHFTMTLCVSCRPQSLMKQPARMWQCTQMCWQRQKF